jgi:hypothetical protein
VELRNLPSVDELARGVDDPHEAVQRVIESHNERAAQS